MVTSLLPQIYTLMNCQILKYFAPIRGVGEKERSGQMVFIRYGRIAAILRVGINPEPLMVHLPKIHEFSLGFNDPNPWR